MIDPVKNRKLTVEEAVAAGVVGVEWKNKLLSAERAVTGYTDPYTESTISLFQALKKDLIVKNHGIRLLEAQIATGGIIDPVHSHRVPVEVAYERGYFDEEMNQILSDPTDDTKGFFDPNTQENLTYLQLVERCVRDPETGLSLLVIVQKGENYFFIDEQTKTVLKSTTTTAAGGKFHGRVVSLWELVYSKYITEEQRRELVQQYSSKEIRIERFMEIILTIIEQKTSTTTTETKCTTNFHGIRKDVTANELLQSKIIDKKLYDDLSAGKVTVQSVSKMDSVRNYLQGTNSIAGVFVQSTKQVMSIFEAKSKGLLTPGTSLVLLEAQAATGFMIDPVKNRKLTVEEAVAAGVVGVEWKNKLLSAERAVTGYTDPYTESTISLFQALKKDLIVKNHGIRLLEAQIATGGIIDPVHSHRVPVEVAYERGYFDEEMNQILSDPTDDTKGFFDPNTQENLTYLQLVESAGKVTVQSVSKMDSVRNYLQGTNSIAGVFVQSTKQVMSIFEAKSKGLLTPGTSLVLLEAQAATGFMIDPVKNRKLTVEEAVAAGVVGVEWKNKLLSAERAVTGYTDPYTESTISLFQALKKDLIVKNHGIRLLEAQIATGGIIDPVHSHRVPVEVAYERGYFDEEMNQILSDPTDDTKGFFDPNTQENLTYLQLVERCVRDPETGLSLLSLNK
ncbi:hypothetical protein AAFF_G00383520 [Aldrovandia affinis]|uniref:Uncharacterized protein n=1 Tax=Aldrovandia affinis TaxID=143900 RepID=A0AAD7SFH3_9TELE|nr:hypothetical protein AAFF_G00383520 [Aldrovandia affinis]